VRGVVQLVRGDALHGADEALRHPDEPQAFPPAAGRRLLLGAINALEKERNVFLERQHAFARGRIRARMRGNRQLSKVEREIVRTMI
jgi:hypothetical protein